MGAAAREQVEERRELRRRRRRRHRRRRRGIVGRLGRLAVAGGGRGGREAAQRAQRKGDAAAAMEFQLVAAVDAGVEEDRRDGRRVGGEELDEEREAARLAEDDAARRRAHRRAQLAQRRAATVVGARRRRRRRRRRAQLVDQISHALRPRRGGSGVAVAVAVAVAAAASGGAAAASCSSSARAAAQSSRNVFAWRRISGCSPSAAMPAASSRSLRPSSHRPSSPHARARRTYALTSPLGGGRRSWSSSRNLAISIARDASSNAESALRSLRWASARLAYTALSPLKCSAAREYAASASVYCPALNARLPASRSLSHAAFCSRRRCVRSSTSFAIASNAAWSCTAAGVSPRKSSSSGSSSKRSHPR